MLTETDLELPDGRTLHVYDTAGDGEDRLALLWHHGTPNLGAPPQPLLPGRDLASAAADAAAIADRLGISRFAVMGHSGGSNHALASGCWRWCACPRWRPCTPKAWTGSRAWPPGARPEDGHISVLAAAENALDWLKEHASRG